MHVIFTLPNITKVSPSMIGIFVLIDRLWSYQSLQQVIDDSLEIVDRVSTFTVSHPELKNIKR